MSSLLKRMPSWRDVKTAVGWDEPLGKKLRLEENKEAQKAVDEAPQSTTNLSCREIKLDFMTEKQLEMCRERVRMFVRAYHANKPNPYPLAVMSGNAPVEVGGFYSVDLEFVPTKDNANKLPSILFSEGWEVPGLNEDLQVKDVEVIPIAPSMIQDTRKTIMRLHFRPWVEDSTPTE